MRRARARVLARRPLSPRIREFNACDYYYQRGMEPRSLPHCHASSRRARAAQRPTATPSRVAPRVAVRAS